ncbi:hypothetical protein [Arabiibacter massiliensis]|uniref:hypothetical protein n=1 Tax=Arabiibacter massiliensis TaxID=1870985 RepID=UPI0009BB8739|nr:hypothetical protein [Arabiibacter massiliensis]
MTNRDGRADAPTEEEVASVANCLFNHPRHRELLYKALAFCSEERAHGDAEAHLADQPEAASALQTPYALLRNLVAAGGLSLLAYDEDGRIIDDERAEELRAAGLDDDAIEDLVAEYRLVATAAGRAARDLLAPERRVAAIVNRTPSRREAYARVLGFCTEPRTLDEINSLLADDPALAPSRLSAGQRLHPSYFVDRLEEAGGLVWDGAWVTTAAGKRTLAAV